MILFALAYLGGVLTILSPCILPVLPFVFARADRSFVKSGLPMLVGMALTFAAVSTLAAVGGGWAVRANEYGRWAALALLAVFAATLLSPWLADRISRPFVALGGRLTEATASESNLGQSLLLGVATGLLWAPCAGPILGLILTAAALQGASANTTLLLLAYAIGSGTSLAVVLLTGRRALAFFKKSQAAETWIRRLLGVAVLAGGIAVAFGLDRGILARLSGPATTKLEQGLIARLDPSMAKRPEAQLTAGQALPDLGPMPSLAGATLWLNSPPLSAEALKGKVVLVDFWTYSCINCLRAMPYVEAWAKRYQDQGLVVIGVHTPEFAFERQEANVRKAVADLGVTCPVAMDNDWTIWKAFKNNFWPAHYFIDAKGRVRHEHFGEGEYDHSEQVIRALLAERNGHAVSGGAADVKTAGVQAAADFGDALSPETYLGYAKAQRFSAMKPMAHDSAQTYAAPPALGVNKWTLSGNWRVGSEMATSAAPGAKVIYRFHARDLHLVLGPAPDGKPVRFRIRIDGRPPGADHGVDADAQGDGAVTSQKLYQLVRQQQAGRTRLFEIEFLDAGVQAYAFTFG